MHVNVARALCALVGVLLAGPALADEVVISDVLVSRREVTGQETRADSNRGPTPVSMTSSPTSAAPTSSYYAPPSDTTFFTMGNAVKSPAPDATGDGTAEPQAATGSSFCDACNSCDTYDNSFCAACQGCPSAGLQLFTGIDSWRGIGDRGASSNNLTNNNGGSSGFNYATRLGTFSDVTGIGLQVGGSYGLYDWSGRPANNGTLTTTAVQQQAFFTVGLFKKANENSNWSYGVVHDWMFNQAWGATAIDPTLGQWRGQIAYATSAWNEFGFWGTLRDKGDTNLDSNRQPVSTRSINQANLFWHHKWELGADSWLWVGVPQDSRLNPFLRGNLGDFLVGGSVIAPLDDYVSLYGNFQYMHPSAQPGSVADGESAWYVSFGLQYTIGGHARTSTVAGNCWLPLMPVANNGNFLVDTFQRILP